jgi:hypothetical protein
VLLALTKKALVSKKFKYGKPVIPEDNNDEAGADDGGDDDLDGGQDIADLANQQI